MVPSGTGQTKKAEPVRGGGPVELDSPFREGDAVLYLKRTRLWATPSDPTVAVDGGEERSDAVRLGHEAPGPIATAANRERAISVID